MPGEVPQHQCVPQPRGALIVVAGSVATTQSSLRHSGMARQRQTRNLEIPGSMLRIALE
jgi:hypothetical protein